MRHHLVGYLDPSVEFDAARFVSEARTAIEDIQARGKRPILAGGSGMYLKALTHGLTEMPVTDHALRAELSALPAEEVLRRLNELDPAASEVTDMRNPRRVQRALEIVIQTGRPIAESRGLWDSRETPGFRGILITRTMEDLLARIETRSEEMLRTGAIDEVRSLQNAGSTARMAIGLREIESLLEEPPE